MRLKTGITVHTSLTVYIILQLIILTVSVQNSGCVRDETIDPLDPNMVDQKQVPNYDVVIPGKVYRSGQPTAEGFRYLFDNGLKNVVALRTSRTDYMSIPHEKWKYIHHVKVHDHYPPSRTQMKSILKIVSDEDNWPVLLHCSRGEGRTGVVIATIRYSINGWPMEKALEEAKKYREGDPLNENGLRFLRKWENRYPPGSYKQILQDTNDKSDDQDED